MPDIVKGAARAALVQPTLPPPGHIKPPTKHGDAEAEMFHETSLSETTLCKTLHLSALSAEQNRLQRKPPAFPSPPRVYTSRGSMLCEPCSAAAEVAGYDGTVKFESATAEQLLDTLRHVITLPDDTNPLRIFSRVLDLDFQRLAGTDVTHPDAQLLGDFVAALSNASPARSLFADKEYCRSCYDIARKKLMYTAVHLLEYMHKQHIGLATPLLVKTGQTFFEQKLHAISIRVLQITDPRRWTLDAYQLCLQAHFRIVPRREREIQEVVDAAYELHRAFHGRVAPVQVQAYHDLLQREYSWLAAVRTYEESRNNLYNLLPAELQHWTTKNLDSICDLCYSSSNCRLHPTRTTGQIACLISQFQDAPECLIARQKLVYINTAFVDVCMNHQQFEKGWLVAKDIVDMDTRCRRILILLCKRAFERALNIHHPKHRCDPSIPAYAVAPPVALPDEWEARAWVLYFRYQRDIEAGLAGRDSARSSSSSLNSISSRQTFSLDRRRDDTKKPVGRSVSALSESTLPSGLSSNSLAAARAMASSPNSIALVV